MPRGLGEFEQFVLFAMVELGEEAYGAAVLRSIQQRTGRDVSVGAVGTALDRLETRGYVSSWVGEPTPQRGGRRKKYYRLEPKGAEALKRSYDAFRRMSDGLAHRLGRLTARKAR